MAENDFEKTEQPTPRRLEEARREGQVARSTDLSASVILIGAVLLLYFLGLHLFTGLRVIVESMLASQTSANPTRVDDLGPLTAFAGATVGYTLGLILLGIIVFALLGTIGQIGFLITGKPLQPNFSRLSPLSGLKNLVDLRAGVRLAMSIAKIIVIAGVAGWVIAADLPQIVRLSELQVRPMFTVACQMVFWLALKLAVLLFVLALIDYAFQRYQREKDLRMSKQDIKDEMKRMDGDPLVRQRRSRVARQLALQRVQHAVPRADVIVTNPTHYAVALQYDSTRMKAPRVVAKGADHLALRIRQIAAAHGVPLVERKALAQALYRSVEVGQEVPPQFYNAVAEILAYVYRLGGRRSA